MNIFWNLKLRWRLQPKHHTFPDHSFFKCCSQSSMKPHIPPYLLRPIQYMPGGLRAAQGMRSSPSIWGAHRLMKEADILADEVSSPASVLWLRFKTEQRRGSGKSSHRKWHFNDQHYTDCKVRRPTWVWVSVLSLAVAWALPHLTPSVKHGYHLPTLGWCEGETRACTYHYSWNRINRVFPWWNRTLLPLRSKVRIT